MIDYHCHLLPAIDDGAHSLEESVAMARILAAAGFTVAHCTPHLIKGAYESAPERVRELTAILQSEYDAASVPLRLVAGTEHYLDEFLPAFLEGAITVDGTRCLLVEAPFRCAAGAVSAHVDRLLMQGVVPLIAHPERCTSLAPQEQGRGLLDRLLRRERALSLEGTLMEELKEKGCRFQANLGSFAGVYGEEIRKRALFLLHQGIYDCVGSDAHRSASLEAVIGRGISVVEEAVGRDAAKKLFHGELSG